jgi:diazepam-binding inhibitor (GABA receptor modulator, acyl-CoA-binding protein)
MNVGILCIVESTVGDNETSRPGLLDVKGKYKWDAWKKNSGKSQQTAQQEYIAFVEQLKQK